MTVLRGLQPNNFSSEDFAVSNHTTSKGHSSFPTVSAELWAAVASSTAANPPACFPGPRLLLKQTANVTLLYFNEFHLVQAGS